MNMLYVIAVAVLSLQVNQLDWSMLTATSYRYGTDGLPERTRYAEALQALNGESVVITGYIIPVDVKGGQYVLSQFPLKQCFFCGNAGPETILNLHFESHPPHLLTDMFVAVQGTLVLSEQDGFFFRLENANLAG